MSALQLMNGSNFSGRTTALRQLITDECYRNGRAAAYVGPEVFTSFSGLAATVTGELELLGNGDASAIAAELGIQQLLGRNLSSLSGGEEVLCGIAGCLALQPQLVALDCVLEQLDHSRRVRALQALRDSAASTLAVADNRFREWTDNNVVIHDVKPSPASGPRYGPICASAPLPSRLEKAGDIVIEGLRFQYGAGPWVLDNLNVTLPAGRLIHLAGVNGAGKSTLAKVLVGAVVPADGSFTHHGQCIPWERPGRLAAYHFQNPDMQLFRPTVLDELTAGAKVCGRDSQAVSSLVNSAMTAFGLEQVLATHPQELPFSMRKRVAMAATLACGTPWIVLDEPTLGQDDHASESLAAYMIRLASSGVGIIIISHSEHFVTRLPAMRLTLRDGMVSETEHG